MGGGPVELLEPRVVFGLRCRRTAWSLPSGASLLVWAPLQVLRPFGILRPCVDLPVKTLGPHGAGPLGPVRLSRTCSVVFWGRWGRRVLSQWVCMQMWESVVLMGGRVVLRCILTALPSVLPFFPCLDPVFSGSLPELGRSVRLGCTAGLEVLLFPVVVFPGFQYTPVCLP